MDPALSSSMTHLPPVVVSVWLMMVALDDPDVMDHVTWRLSAELGDVVAVRVILSPTSPEELPEMET